MRDQLNTYKDHDVSHTYGRIPLVSFNPNINSLNGSYAHCNIVKASTYTPRVNSLLGLSGTKKSQGRKVNESFTAGENEALNVYPLNKEYDFKAEAISNTTYQRSKHGSSKSTCENPLTIIKEENLKTSLNLQMEALPSKHKRFKSNDLNGGVKQVYFVVPNYEPAKYCLIENNIVTAYSFNTNKGMIR